MKNELILRKVFLYTSQKTFQKFSSKGFFSKKIFLIKTICKKLMIVIKFFTYTHITRETNRKLFSPKFIRFLKTFFKYNWFAIPPVTFWQTSQFNLLINPSMFSPWTNMEKNFSISYLWISSQTASKCFIPSYSQKFLSLSLKEVSIGIRGKFLLQKIYFECFRLIGVTSCTSYILFKEK